MPECTCFVTPESEWFYYGGDVEPGSQAEPNPDCPVHFPPMMTPRLICPHCKARDTIAEVDRAVRWNDLTVTLDHDGQPHLTASPGKNYAFAHDGFICTACAHHVTMTGAVDHLTWS